MQDERFYHHGSADSLVDSTGVLTPKSLWSDPLAPAEPWMARLKRTAMGPSASDSSAIGDYFTLFKTMSPSYGEGDSHGPLTPSQHLALLPLATGAHLGALFLFMLVEVSGGAGGTSTVASTRSVLLVLVHALLLLMAIALSQRARGGLQTSNAVSLVSSVQGRRSTALKLLR
jgi:hypothetical protein